MSHLVPEVGFYIISLSTAGNIWYQRIWVQHFFYISQAKISTVGKRDGGCDAPVESLGAEVGGRPQAVGLCGGCRRQHARRSSPEGAAALKWLGG